MPKTKNVADDGLWPNEERAMEQYESGKDRPRFFKTAEDLIADLHRSE